MTRNTLSAQIAIATTDPVFRVSLLTVLQSEPGFTAVADAFDEAAGLNLPARAQPDILLPDSGSSGIVKDVVHLWPAARIIVLATIIDQGHVIQALRLAARGLVLKTAP